MRDERYIRLLQSSKWKRIRLQYLSKHPLCEVCEAKGITKAAQEVHHIIPVSKGLEYNRMRCLAYDLNNLQSLCKECHHDVHERMALGSKSRTKEMARAEAEMFINRWTGG